MNPRVKAAWVLYGQGRIDDAEREALAGLAEEPDDGKGHAILALCRGGKGRQDEALASAREAVRLAPGWGQSHFVLGKVRFDRDENGEAATALREAIRLDPGDASYRWVLAAVLLDSGEPGEALAAADEGLRLDPGKSKIHSLRGLALYRLDRVPEAEESFRRALALDPENDVAHAGLGRVAASQGRADEAVARYLDALRIDPHDAGAWQGLLEALRARYPVYGTFLRWLEWTRRLSGRMRAFLYLGLGLLFKSSKKALQEAEGPLQWALGTVFGAYVLLVLMTWVAEPAFNLLLRLRREGRLVLSREEIAASNVVGAALGASVLLAAAAYLERSLPLGVGALLFFLALPALSLLHGMRRGVHRAVAGGLFLVVLSLGGAGVALSVLQKREEPGSPWPWRRASFSSSPPGWPASSDASESDPGPGFRPAACVGVGSGEREPAPGRSP